MTQQGEFVEIDLMDAVRDVKGAKKTLLAAAALGALLAILIAIFGGKSYTAQAELGPAESNAPSNSDTALSEISGAASLLGVTVGQPDTDFVKYKELLRSQRLADALYQNDSARAIIFSARWDAEKHQWNGPSGAGAAVAAVFHLLTGGAGWSPPGPFDVQQYLDAKLDILTDKVTGYFKASIAEDTPEHATLLLSSIILTADGIMRQSVKNKASARIAYLTKTLKSTTLQDERNTMINLLAAQEKILMLSSADRTYAVDVIDPPAANPAPTSPRLLELLAGYVLGALFLVICWAILRGTFFVRRGRGEYSPSLDAAAAAWLRRRKEKLPGAKRSQPSRT